MNFSRSHAKKETRIQGTPISEGIGIGYPFFLLSAEEDIPEFPITMNEVDQEISRYREALFSSKEDLRRLQENLEVEGSSEALSFIDAHIQMLDDPLITTHMEDKIRQMLRNTESVFRSVIKDFEKQFSSRSNSFFRERFVDVMDISKRILGHLRHEKRLIHEIPEKSIVIAKELIPSHTAAVQGSQVNAFITQIGGNNAHAALIARAKGIPFVANVDLIKLQEIDSPIIIVDGNSGEVILHPQQETLEYYHKRKTQVTLREQILEQEEHLLVETIDGYQVRLFLNLGNLAELDRLPSNISGVGLFRTEYMFLQRPLTFPNEEEQFVLYSEILKKTNEMPFVFRVFDIGGDKNPELFLDQKEPNPALGCRGIRFLLKNRNLFKIQVRAILRANQSQQVRLLLPFISDVREVVQARALIEETKRELLAEEMLSFSPQILIGCMIEIPSSVMSCDILMKHCDFLSLGTNDLVQYTLGVDRSNLEMQDLLYPLHPSILRMIKMLTMLAGREEKSLTICGEIASNPLFIPLLLGLGLKEFSCSLRYIPLIKQQIRKCRIVEAYRLAEELLRLQDPTEISCILEETL